MNKVLLWERLILIVSLSVLLLSGCTSVSPKTSVNIPQKASTKSSKIPPHAKPVHANQASFFSQLKGNNIVIQLPNTKKQAHAEALAYVNHKLRKSIPLPLTSVSSAIRSAVVDYEKRKPTVRTATSAQLARCQLVKLPVELDDRANTTEWLVTIDNNCPNPSAGKFKTFWVTTQTANKQPKVVIADKADVVSFESLSKGRSNRKISVALSDRNFRCERYWSKESGVYSSASGHSVQGVEGQYLDTSKCPLY